MNKLILALGVLLLVLIPVVVMYNVEQYQPNLVAKEPHFVAHHPHHHHNHPHPHHPNHPPAPHNPRRHYHRHYRHTHPIVIGPRYHWWDRYFNALQYYCNKCDICKMGGVCDSVVQDFHCDRCPVLN